MDGSGHRNGRHADDHDNWDLVGPLRVLGARLLGDVVTGHVIWPVSPELDHSVPRPVVLHHPLPLSSLA